MGIETILIVLGAIIVIALAVGARRAKRKAADTQTRKPDTPSTVKRTD